MVVHYGRVHYGEFLVLLLYISREYFTLNTNSPALSYLSTSVYSSQLQLISLYVSNLIFLLTIDSLVSA